MPLFKDQPKISISNSNLSNSPIIVNSPGTQINFTPNTIGSIRVEASLLVTLKDNAEIPEPEIEFMPIGNGSHGKIGASRLEFVSPVYFKKDGSNMEVTNIFGLTNASEFLQRPLDSLLGVQLEVPITTIVYGQGFAKIKNLSVRVFVNNNLVYHQNWDYDIPFQNGPRFSINLE